MFSNDAFVCVFQVRVKFCSGNELVRGPLQSLTKF